MAFITGGRTGPTGVRIVNILAGLKYTPLTAWIPWPNIILPGRPTGEGGATQTLGGRVHNFFRAVPGGASVENFRLIGYRR